MIKLHYSKVKNSYSDIISTHLSLIMIAGIELFTGGGPISSKSAILFNKTFLSSLWRDFSSSSNL